MEGKLLPRSMPWPGNTITSGAVPVQRGGYPPKIVAVSRSALMPSNLTEHVAMDGRDLYLMAQQYGQEHRHLWSVNSHGPRTLKKPRDFSQRLVYALAAISPFQTDWRPLSAAARNYSGLVPADYQPAPNAKGVYLSHISDYTVYERKRIRRDTRATSSRPKPDWKYRLAAFMNLHTASSLELDAIDDEQLAKVILHSIKPHPELIPDIARLALFGSNLYGERQGEDISPEQQLEMIGQALCKLIFKEENVGMRVAKIYARMRPCTLRELTAAVYNWTFSSADEQAQWIWRQRFEAYEIPDIYLVSGHKLGSMRKETQSDKQALHNRDDLWVGSPTWVLLHTGARALLSSGSDDLSWQSALTLIQLGLGIISAFEKGDLANAAEPSLYYGLLVYHLSIFPDAVLEESLSIPRLTQTFEHLLKTLAGRHKTARYIFESFTAYRQVYSTRPWRWRKWAAQELLSRTCGTSSRLAPIEKKSFLMAFQGVYADPILQLMAYPTGQRCLSTNKSVPDLNEYYRRAVEKAALHIHHVDKALLEVAFTPSDFCDENLQYNEWEFLNQADIELVEPRLYRIRHKHEMFFSNVIISYLSKADTVFFLARFNSQKKLYSLKTTENGYKLRQINTEDPELRDLRPYMRSWPSTKIKNIFRFQLMTLENPAINKNHQENLTQLYTRYADMHYQAYRARLYEIGYQTVGAELPEIIDDIQGLIIPFYDCISSLKKGDKNISFIECSVDGMLVGLPIFFTGVKASLSLYRQALIGSARTFTRSSFIASPEQLFRNTIPISTQIAGGVIGTSEQLNTFLFNIGKQVVKSCDPGIAAIRSLGIVGHSLRMAVAGHALTKISPHFLRESRHLSAETHKILTARTSRLYDISYGYGENGLTPLTLTLEGIDYSVLETYPPIMQAPIIAVENGELSDMGYPVFVQLDMQTQLGIYKKYVCLDIGQRHCQLQEYLPQETIFDVKPIITARDDENLQWLLVGTTPIYLAVVYPQHRVSFSGRQKLFFEINGQGWAFNPESHELNPVGYLDDWHMRPRSWNDPFATLDITNNHTGLQLRMHQAPPSITVSASLQKFRTSRAFLSSYELTGMNASPETIGFYDSASLIARIDTCWYWLKLEPRKSTFLLTHPTRHRAGSLRVVYDFTSSSFLLATPADRLNSHRFGEPLAREIAARGTGPCIHRLLPPQLNGAFRFGSVMFIKLGDICLNIQSYDGLYYLISDDDDQENSLRWSLRYELFTESFALIAKTDPMLAPIDSQQWSKFEQLAMRTYNRTAFPTMKALCQADREEPALQSRLRQTALVIRLDPARRMMLLHASSAIVRTFKLDTALTASYKAAYPALALWTTFEKTVDGFSSCCPLKYREWDKRQLSRADVLPDQFPPPDLVALGHKQRPFLIYRTESDEEKAATKYIELRVKPQGLSAIPEPAREKLRRWMPDPIKTSTIIVSKYVLNIGRQITFWLNKANQIIGRQPESDNIQFLGNYSQSGVNNIVVSPDGDIVVLLYSVDILALKAEFYRLPGSRTKPALMKIRPHKQTMIVDTVTPYCDYWVTNQGELFIPRGQGWAAPDNKRHAWPIPENSKASFVTRDQHYLGYVRQNAQLHLQDIILYDTISQEKLSLSRSKPPLPRLFGTTQAIAAAFSALNTLIAVGYSDGYIEIYRIAASSMPTSVLPLGGTYLPLARYIIDGESYFKAKQMVMKFNNAFDELMVFHDEGDCNNASKGNFTFALTQVFPGKNDGQNT